MKTILVSGIGGPTPRSIAKTIRKFFPEYRIVGIDSKQKAIGFFMPGLLDKYYSVPGASSNFYWEKIKKIISSEEVNFAFIQPEQEVLAWGKYILEHYSFPCPTFIPPIQHSNVMVNKAAMSELLKGTSFIPKTRGITPSAPNFEQIESEIGFPCWIRASVGSGGLGSLKLHNRYELEAWLYIHKEVSEFTVSEFLPGRHLANQMMYIDGEYIRSAGLQCSEYVMADIAPSKVTGNTSYGLLINENQLLEFCKEVMTYIIDRTRVKAHGVYSFDLKEDLEGNLKVTEINIRHMAYTGVMADAGFDLISDTISFLTGKMHDISKGNHHFDNDYVFLRDVDIEPILLTQSDLRL